VLRGNRVSRSWTTHVPFIIVVYVCLYTMASAALLQQIQAGKRLKKAETSDRSAPIISNDSKKGSGSTVGRAPPVPSSGVSGAPPQLGALFAGGVPKLKPAADRGDQGTLITISQ
jgi:hypothetical protein